MNYSNVYLIFYLQFSTVLGTANGIERLHFWSGRRGWTNQHKQYEIRHRGKF